MIFNNSLIRYSFRLLCIFIFPLSCFAQIPQKTILIQQTQKAVSIGKQTLLLEDKSAQLSFQDILKGEQQKRFALLNKEVFNSPVSRSVYWFKFTIQNKTGQKLWLKIGDAFNTLYADFYAPNAQGAYNNPRKTGAMRPVENKEFPTKLYCVALNNTQSKQPQTYYLRVYGKFPKTYAFQIGTSLTIPQVARNLDYSMAAFVGLMLAMLIYNLFVYFSVKDKVYLFYVGYLLSMLWTVPLVQGYPFFEGTWQWDYIITLHIPLFFFITAFATYYLNLPKVAPRFFKVCLVPTALLVVVYPVSEMFNLIDKFVLSNLDQLTLFVYYICLFSAGIYVWRKGHKNARFYVLGWFTLFASVFGFLFTINGILPYNNVTYNIPYIGVSLEALMFSLALGDRLNTLKKEKEKAQAENLRIVTAQNEILEEKVKEKTKELQEANEELITNNEELTQSQEEIAAQRDILEVKNKELTLSQEEIEAQRDLLDDQNQRLRLYSSRIGHSFNAAKLIQTAILPTQQVLAEKFKEHFVLNMPKDVVSGDFYWITELDQKLVFVVADCTGHGVPGAFMTLIGNNLLDKIVHIGRLTDPAQILSLLHIEINQVLKQDKTQNESGMDAIVVTLETNNENTQVAFCGAKNDLLYYDAHQRQMTLLKGTRKSIGGYQPDQIQFKTQHIHLPKNSILYLGSDGFVDQNDVKRKKFGSKRLYQALQDMVSEPLNEQKDQLQSILKDYMKETEQRDDILWIGVKL